MNEWDECRACGGDVVLDADMEELCATCLDRPLWCRCFLASWEDDPNEGLYLQPSDLDAGVHDSGETH